MPFATVPPLPPDIAEFPSKNSLQFVFISAWNGVALGFLHGLLTSYLQKTTSGRSTAGHIFTQILVFVFSFSLLSFIPYSCLKCDFCKLVANEIWAGIKSLMRLSRRYFIHMGAFDYYVNELWAVWTVLLCVRLYFSSAITMTLLLFKWWPLWP